MDTKQTRAPVPTPASALNRQMAITREESATESASRSPPAAPLASMGIRAIVSLLLATPPPPVMYCYILTYIYSEPIDG